MADTPGRLLRLLSLLQSRPAWPAAELADRLGVTDRTVRRDVARLRALGYPVDAEPGPHGGYRLGRGGSLPPLLLDDDEAVAVAVGLQAAADGSVEGLDLAAVSALAKLDQVMPAPLAARVRALPATTVHLWGSDPRGSDPGVLLALAQACRATHRVRFRYVDREGRATDRVADPHRLVRSSWRWYLVARAVGRPAPGEADGRAGWRSFRVDRISEPEVLPIRVELVDPPDPAELVARGMAVEPYRIRARLRVPLPPDRAREVLPRTIAVAVTDAGVGGTDATVPGTTVVEFGANDLEGMAAYVAGLAVIVEVLDPPELRAALAGRGRRLAEANP
jgi:predicted DNA-binding transcriptional regulator YafY